MKDLQSTRRDNKQLRIDDDFLKLKMSIMSIYVNRARDISSVMSIAFHDVDLGTINMFFIVPKVNVRAKLKFKMLI